MGLFFNDIPTCPICLKQIKFYGVQDDHEIYKCDCGLCDEERPII